jgi:hypothetical protein
MRENEKEKQGHALKLSELVVGGMVVAVGNQT